jgi:hypothetical protein
MDKRKYTRTTERVNNMLGHIKARDVAMSDIREDLEFGNRYTAMLVYSVKEQLRCFNDLSVCSIDHLAEDFKVIPQPPRREKRKGEYVSVYENQCLFGEATYGRYFQFDKSKRSFVGDHHLLSKLYKFYLLEIKQAEGLISPHLFWFIQSIGIKIGATKGGVAFNIHKDYIEDGDFYASIYDFIRLEDVPLDIYIRTENHIIEQYKSILNIIDAKKNNLKYGDKYDFRENSKTEIHLKAINKLLNLNT